MTTPHDPWLFVDRWPDLCVAEASRRGESQPCDKAAYAVVRGSDEEGLRYWPVCVHHARGWELVPLKEILDHQRNDPTP